MATVVKQQRQYQRSVEVIQFGLTINRVVILLGQPVPRKLRRRVTSPLIGYLLQAIALDDSQSAEGIEQQRADLIARYFGRLAYLDGSGRVKLGDTCRTLVEFSLFGQISQSRARELRQVLDGLNDYVNISWSERAWV